MSDQVGPTPMTKEQAIVYYEKAYDQLIIRSQNIQAELKEVKANLDAAKEAFKAERMGLIFSFEKDEKGITSQWLVNLGAKKLDCNASDYLLFSKLRVEYDFGAWRVHWMNPVTSGYVHLCNICYRCELIAIVKALKIEV